MSRDECICFLPSRNRQKMADDFARLKAWRAQSGTEGQGWWTRNLTVTGLLLQEQYKSMSRDACVRECFHTYDYDHERIYACMHGSAYRLHARKGGWMDGWMDGRMDAKHHMDINVWLRLRVIVVVVVFVMFVAAAAAASAASTFAALLLLLSLLLLVVLFLHE